MCWRLLHRDRSDFCSRPGTLQHGHLHMTVCECAITAPRAWEMDSEQPSCCRHYSELDSASGPSSHPAPGHVSSPSYTALKQVPGRSVSAAAGLAVQAAAGCAPGLQEHTAAQGVMHPGSCTNCSSAPVGSHKRRRRLSSTPRLRCLQLQPQGGTSCPRHCSVMRVPRRFALSVQMCNDL